MSTRGCNGAGKLFALVAGLSLCVAAPAAGQVKITQTREQIAVEIDGKPFTVFYIGGKDLNRPYLHPLRTASGKIVNRSVPAGQLPGETTDHPHHAGLFYGHGDVNGYNFWAIQNVQTPPSKADSTMGRIVLKNVASVKSGKESGTVDVVLTWLKPDGKPLLTETRRMTFYAHPELRIIDFDFDFAAIDKVVFRDTKEGTFAMRMATPLDEPPAKEKPGGPAENGQARQRTGRRAGSERLGQTVRVGGLLGRARWREGRRRDDGSSRQPSTSDLLALTRVWIALDQSVRSA